MYQDKINDNFNDKGGGGKVYNRESGVHLMAEVVEFRRNMPKPSSLVSPPKFFDFDSPYETHSNVQNHKIPINPGETHTLVAGQRLTLTGNTHESCFRISLDQDSELMFEMVAGAKNAGKTKRHADLAVLTVAVDGKEHDVPLRSGEQKTKYGLHLGELARGSYEIAIKYAPQKSSINTYGAEIYRAIVICPLASFRKFSNPERQSLPAMYSQK